MHTKENLTQRHRDTESETLKTVETRYAAIEKLPTTKTQRTERKYPAERERRREFRTGFTRFSGLG
jgi:hypothetical protein